MSRLEKEILENVTWMEECGGEVPDLLVDSLPVPELLINGKRIVSFCSNNYFGLSMHPIVLRAASKALKRYGVGTCESRRLGGNLRLLGELEDKIASFKGKESGVIFPTGYLTNLSVIPALTDTSFYRHVFWKTRKTLGAPPIILSDELNHRSIQLGIKLSHAESVRYRHNDINHLEQLLSNYMGRSVLVITDSVFSMDGDLARLDEIAPLTKAYGAMLMIDEAHGTGIYGQSGRGVAEHFGVSELVDVHMGTFSKTFGGIGGFVAVSEQIAKAIKYTSSGYYFTSSLPAEQAAGLIAAIGLIENNQRYQSKLWRNVEYATLGLADIGIEFPQRWSHIIPVFIRDNKKARFAQQFLLDRGILCTSVHAPAVNPETSRLRVTINSTHTQKHMDILLQALRDLAYELRLPIIKVSKQDLYGNLGEPPY